MKISIRKFESKDIPKKQNGLIILRITNIFNYDIPLKIEKTEKWFENNKDRTDRFDAVIEADGVPCGTIGLLSIDQKNKKAEYYIAMGEISLKGKGVSTNASKLLLEYAFNVLKLNRVYLFTEKENLIAQKLFEKVGFIREGLIREDIISRGKYVDRYIYGICKKDFLSEEY